jgi:hypothetical protein
MTVAPLRPALPFLAALACCALTAGAPARKTSSGPYAAWKNGPSADPGYFPIAVWLQSPENAARYKAAGINLFVGLWQGPTEAQLAGLKAAGMRVICEQNAVGLKHLEDPTIAGWMHGDEPDNAQELPGGKGYGGPIPYQKIIADYQKIRQADPTRPVMLNLGQGVANDEWIGRGAKPENYPDYCKGADIVSFDVYPVAGLDKPQSEDYLWYVPKGIDRIRKWTDDRKLAWNCIECTQIGKPDRQATPDQVRSEVWMSLIHGSRGLIYFVHQFQPKFNEHALLDDPQMLPAVTAINRQVAELAPVLNSPTLSDAATVAPSDPEAPVDIAVKRRRGATYVLACGMRNKPGKAAFNVLGMGGERKVTVLGENRSVTARDGRFEDSFGRYGVHLYRVER